SIRRPPGPSNKDGDLDVDAAPVIQSGTPAPRTPTLMSKGVAFAKAGPRSKPNSPPPPLGGVDVSTMTLQASPTVPRLVRTIPASILSSSAAWRCSSRALCGADGSDPTIHTGAATTIRPAPARPSARGALSPGILFRPPSAAMVPNPNAAVPAPNPTSHA